MLHGVDTSEVKELKEEMRLGGGGESTTGLERLPDREWLHDGGYSVLILRVADIVGGSADWASVFACRVEVGSGCGAGYDASFTGEAGRWWCGIDEGGSAGFDLPVVILDAPDATDDGLEWLG